MSILPWNYKARFSTNLNQFIRSKFSTSHKWKTTYLGVSKQGKRKKKLVDTKCKSQQAEMKQDGRPIFLVLVPKSMLPLEDHVTILLYRQTNTSDDNLAIATLTQKRFVFDSFRPWLTLFEVAVKTSRSTRDRGPFARVFPPSAFTFHDHEGNFKVTSSFAT